MNDTITAIATPVGEGGISVVRISGAKALDIAGKLFRPSSGKSVAEISPMQVRLGEILDPANGQCVDEALLTWFKAPKSFTGEHIIEISAHGGAHVSARILQLILSQGARLAKPGEFTRRAFTNGRLDLAQAEAVADIIGAASDKALQSALGTFEDVSARAGIEVDGWSVSASFLDYDRDGFLDLYVVRYVDYDVHVSTRYIDTPF